MTSEQERWLRTLSPLEHFLLMDLSWVCCFSQSQGREEADMPKVHVSSLGFKSSGLDWMGSLCSIKLP